MIPVEFRDASALVKALVAERGSEGALKALELAPQVALWWGTPTEIVAAIERRRRNRESDAAACDAARRELDDLLADGRFDLILPNEAVRALSFEVLARHPLRAADALQLAAALVLRAGSYPLLFRTEDRRLAEAATAEGLTVPPPFGAP